MMQVNDYQQAKNFFDEQYELRQRFNINDNITVFIHNQKKNMDNFKIAVKKLIDNYTNDINILQLRVPQQNEEDIMADVGNKLNDIYIIFKKIEKTHNVSLKNYYNFIGSIESYLIGDSGCCTKQFRDYENVKIQINDIQEKINMLQLLTNNYEIQINDFIKGHTY